MKKIIILSLILITSNSCISQSQEFDKLVSAYKTKISLPINSIFELKVKDTISLSLLNTVLFDQQADKVMFYTEQDSLYKVTTYGRVHEKPTKWRTWADNSRINRIEKTFVPKAYPVGYISIADNYLALVTKVVAFETTYYDLYLFDKNGILKSLVNLYEAEYERPGRPEGNFKVYIQSSITKAGIIKWHEERFNVTTDREYQIQSDGYFKVIKQNVEGEFEY